MRIREDSRKSTQLHGVMSHVRLRERIDTRHDRREQRAGYKHARYARVIAWRVDRSVDGLDRGSGRLARVRWSSFALDLRAGTTRLGPCA